MPTDPPIAERAAGRVRRGQWDSGGLRPRLQGCRRRVVRHQRSTARARPSTAASTCSGRPATGVKGEGHGAAAPVSARNGGTAATAPARRSAVPLCFAGARSGVGVQAADVGSLTTQNQHRGGGGPRHGAGVSTVRTPHELSRYTSSYMVGPLGTAEGLSGAVPLLALQTGTAASRSRGSASASRTASACA